MSLLVVGLSHRTAPVSLLERAARRRRPAADGAATSCSAASTSARSWCCPPATGSRCTRRSTGSTAACRTPRPCWPTGSAWTSPSLGEHLYVHYEDAAVLHLFSVAAGLDSMVVGESQILGQLRDGVRGRGRAGRGQPAAARALPARAAGGQAGALGDRHRPGRRLGRLGRARPRPSATLGPLAGKRALVIGAGSMGALSAATLARAGHRASWSSPTGRRRRAERLAAQLDGPARAVPLDDVAGRAGRCRRGRRLHRRGRHRAAAADGRGVAAGARAAARWCCSTSRCRGTSTVPPASLPGVHYLDLAALQEPAVRLGAHEDVERARQIVGRGGRRPARRPPGHRGRPDGDRAAGPGGRGGRRRAGPAGRPAARRSTRSPGPRSRAAVHRVVQTLLHAPTVRVKELAERPGGDAYADALRELFDLDPAATAAVGRRRTARTDEEAAVTLTRRCGSGPGAARWPAAQTAWSSPRWPASGSRPSAVEIVTTGDRSTAALTQIGGTGVFVSALRDALLGRRDRRRRALVQGPADRSRRTGSWSRPCRRARTRATCWSRATGSPWPSCRPAPSSAPARPAGPRRSRALGPGRRGRADPRQRGHPAAQGGRRRGGRGGAGPGRPGPARPAGRGHRDARPAAGAARAGAGRARRSSAARPTASWWRSSPRSTTPTPGPRSSRSAPCWPRLEAGCTAPVGALAVIAEGDARPGTVPPRLGDRGRRLRRRPAVRHRPGHRRRRRSVGGWPPTCSPTAPRISLGARDEPRAQDHRSDHLRRGRPRRPRPADRPGRRGAALGRR